VPRSRRSPHAARSSMPPATWSASSPKGNHEEPQRNLT
jgi:hypothetical protein